MEAIKRAVVRITRAVLICAVAYAIYNMLTKLTASAPTAEYPNVDDEGYFPDPVIEGETEKK